MSQSPESREEAIARLQKRASELETTTARQVSDDLAGHRAASQAWRIIADLLGGVFLGVAIGFGVDYFAKTSPVGIISGVLLGFAVSVWMAWRTSQRIMAEAKASGVQPQAVPFDDEEEDA